MSDTITTASAAPQTDPSKNLTVPVTKAKDSITVNHGQLPDDVYMACLAKGIETIVNSNMTKLGTAKSWGDSDADKARFKAAVMEIAAKNVEAMYAGTIKLPRGTHTKTSGDHPANVVTEARRIAKTQVKEAMKAKKIRIASVAASDITKAANALLDNPEVGPGLYAQAEKNLAEQGKITVAGDFLSKVLPKEDPVKVRALEEKAAAAKSKVSAKQAGMTTAH